MKNREAREREYFDNDFKPTSSFMPEEDEHIFDEVYDQVISIFKQDLDQDIISRRGLIEVIYFLDIRL